MIETPHFAEIMKREFSRRVEKNPAYSLRSFARALQISSTTLSLIFSGSRVPSVQVTERLVSALSLSPKEESEFLASLIKVHKRKGVSSRKSYFLSRFSEDQVKDRRLNKAELDLKLFQVISDWYHYAIMMLMESEGAKPEPQWIAKQLGISVIEAKTALARLLSLGLLRPRKNGTLSVDASYLTTADKHVTTMALKKHQRQILEKSIQSLENDPIETRNISSLTMSIDPERLPKAKDMIEDFNQKLCAFLEGGNRKQVYQLSVALFPIQKIIRSTE